MSQTEPETKTFTESQMVLLRRVVDCLIPAEGEMPSASLVGTAEYIDEIASGDDLTKFPFLTESAGYLDSDSVYIDRPKLRRLLLEGLKEIEDKVIESAQGESEFISTNTLVKILSDIELSSPVFFRKLIRLTYNNYYTTQEVLRLIGTEVRAPQPQGYELESGNLDLLNAVKERGQIWRRA